MTLKSNLRYKSQKNGDIGKFGDIGTGSILDENREIA